jgi:hypothetical protein
MMGHDRGKLGGARGRIPRRGSTLCATAARAAARAKPVLRRAEKFQVKQFFAGF